MSHADKKYGPDAGGHEADRADRAPADSTRSLDLSGASITALLHGSGAGASGECRKCRYDRTVFGYRNREARTGDSERGWV